MVHFMVAVVTISAIFVGYIALLVFMIVKCCRGLMSAESDEFSEDSIDEADLRRENEQVHPDTKSENQANENGHQKVEQAKETQEQWNLPQDNIAERTEQYTARQRRWQRHDLWEFASFGGYQVPFRIYASKKCK